MVFVTITVLVVILAATAIFARNKSNGNALLGQMRTKQDNLEHILNMFDERDQIIVHDVEKLLGVSGATANNYLNELLEDGHLERRGSNTGYIYTRK